MKAIQTRYGGHHFRSRLEARWAVFFDSMEFDWDYEPEGFVLSSGAHYLPDFRVVSPQGHLHWYEIKPRHVVEDPKFREFSGSVSHFSEVGEEYVAPTQTATLLSGDPMDWVESIYGEGAVPQGGVCPRCGILHTYFESGVRIHDQYETWVGCEFCDWHTPCGGDNDSDYGVMGIICLPHKGLIMVETQDWNRLWHAVGVAARAAREARFEHGENGGRAQFIPRSQMAMRAGGRPPAR
jgi:hypothetical protein